MKKFLKNVLALAALGALALAQTPGSKSTVAPAQKDSTEKHTTRHMGKLKPRQKEFGPNDKMAAAGKACEVINKDKKGQICAYDIEQIPAAMKSDHPAVYVSFEQQESILWYSSAAHKFHIQRLKAMTAHCPEQPFRRSFYDSTGTPEDSSVASDSARKEAVGCEYKTRVRVKLDDGKTENWDPHIIIGP